MRNSACSIQAGPLVFERLIQPKELQLHSHFKNGCNLIVENQLLFIGTNEKGIIPFGLHLPTAEFQQIYPALLAMDIQRDGNPHNLSITIGNKTIRLNHAAVSALRLPTAVAFTAAHIQTMIHHLDQYLDQTGLLFSERPDWSENPSWMASRQTDRAFDSDEIEQFIQSLIGRGPGLTPSGDDFLVGILAVDQLSGFLPHTFYDILSKEITKDTTTLVSRNYLAAALQGHFSSVIVESVSALIHPNHQPTNCLPLVTTGHTSGADTLCGINWAFRQILLKKQGAD